MTATTAQSLFSRFRFQPSPVTWASFVFVLLIIIGQSQLECQIDSDELSSDELSIECVQSDDGVGFTTEVVESGACDDECTEKIEQLSIEWKQIKVDNTPHPSVTVSDFFWSAVYRDEAQWSDYEQLTTKVKRVVSEYASGSCPHNIKKLHHSTRSCPQSVSFQQLDALDPQNTTLEDFTRAEANWLSEGANEATMVVCRAFDWFECSGPFFDSHWNPLEFENHQLPGVLALSLLVSGSGGICTGDPMKNSDVLINRNVIRVSLMDYVVDRLLPAICNNTRPSCDE